MATTDALWERVFLAVTDTFWPEFFHGELNEEDLEKARRIADRVMNQTDDEAAYIAGSTAPADEVTRLSLFELLRHVDVTGKSGTGVVAHGAQWPDGTVSLRWAGATPSFSNWDSVDVLLAVHGHEGATEVRWLNLPETMFRTRDIDLSEDEPLEQVAFKPIDETAEHQEPDERHCGDFAAPHDAHTWAEGTQAYVCSGLTAASDSDSRDRSRDEES